MITLLINITTKHVGGKKTASVFALNDAKAGDQKITFTIIDQVHETTEHFAANEGKEVSVTHTATGQGFVVAVSGTARDQRFCNVDAADCSGLKAADIAAALSSK
jgi:hypothetical protein